MIVREVGLPAARGARLAHGLLLDGVRHAKGQLIDEALLAAAGRAGIATLWVAVLPAGFIDEDEAARALAARLAGPGIGAATPSGGRVHLTAADAGLLEVPTHAVHALNLLDEAFALATAPPSTPAEAGQLVATVKIIPFAVAPDLMEQALALAQPMVVHPWRPGCTARLVRTRNGASSDKALDKVVSVTAGRLSRLGLVAQVPPPIAHELAPLSAALASAAEPLVLIAGASATTDAGDVVPSAIRAAGGEVVRLGMPVDPGNLLVVGRRGTQLIVGLPGCARSPARNGLDLILERFAAGLPVTSALIAGMGVGGLFEDGGRAVPWAFGA